MNHLDQNEYLQELMGKKESELTFVAFDTETSGPYPDKDDVVEFAAIKWQAGKEVDRCEFLFKPREKMTDFIIGIHGITNEMVQNSGSIGEKAEFIRDFFRGAIPLAHHAPFDMGFMALEFERKHLKFPDEPALCTSLLARNLISGVPNHRLQTLVQHFKIPTQAAHRALEDAKACLRVFQECVKEVQKGMAPGTEPTLGDLIMAQRKRLLWSQYSMLNSTNKDLQNLIKAIEKKSNIHMLYTKGIKKSVTRTLTPLGVILNPDGNYLQAIDLPEGKSKRFLLEFVKEVELTM